MHEQAVVLVNDAQQWLHRISRRHARELARTRTCQQAFRRYTGRRVKFWNQIGLPLLLIVVFALSRWPGVMPDNFSTVYALVFCAGVFLPRALAWWLLR